MDNTSPGSDPVVVAETMTEIEAAIIRGTLESEGVQSWIFGGLLTGLRAETPGRAQVVVRAEDAELAREILATVELEAQAGRSESDSEEPI